MSNNTHTLVCYLIRVSNLDTGLLAVTFLERISPVGLQGFCRGHPALPALTHGGSER